MGRADEKPVDIASQCSAVTALQGGLQGGAVSTTTLQDQAPLSHGDRYRRGLKEAEKVRRITMQFLPKRDKYWGFEEEITRNASLVYVYYQKKRRKIQLFFPSRQCSYCSVI